MYKRTFTDLHMTDGAHLLKLQQSLLEGSKAEQCLLGACKCPVKLPACESMAACKAATIGSGENTSLQNERKLCQPSGLQTHKAYRDMQKSTV